MSFVAFVLSPEEEAELAEIRRKAKQRHLVARKEARRLGRKDFPELPFECSWAYLVSFERLKFRLRR